MHTVSSSDSLLYEHDGNWQPLPYRWLWFLKLGMLLSDMRDRSTRCVVGIAVPTRAFAAAFIAAGFLAKLPPSIPSSDETIEHFQALSRLPAGTSVHYRAGERMLRGILNGVDYERSDDGQPLLVIQTEAGGWRYIPPKLAVNVKIADRDFDSLPKTQKGRAVAVTSQFARLFIELLDGKPVLGVSNLDCLIVGPLKQVSTEAEETPLAVGTPETLQLWDAQSEWFTRLTWTRTKTETKRVEQLLDMHERPIGTLLDVMRVKRLSRAGDVYRSDIYSTVSGLPDSIKQASPAVVLFDGATSYLRWRAYWPHAHHVAILDRTAPAFDTGMQAFNEDFSKRLADGGLPGIPASPRGLELQLYLDACP